MATPTESDQMRIKYGFWVVITGLTIIAVVFVIAIMKWSAAGDVAAAVGSVTGVIGTVVGAFFGVHVGSQGKEKAEDRALTAESARKTAEERAIHLAAAAQPEIATRIMGMQF